MFVMLMYLIDWIQRSNWSIALGTWYKWFEYYKNEFQSRFRTLAAFSSHIFSLSVSLWKVKKHELSVEQENRIQKSLILVLILFVSGYTNWSWSRHLCLPCLVFSSDLNVFGIIQHYPKLQQYNLRWLKVLLK